MLEVNQLSRKYGSFVAVDNVSFTINKGEIVGLLGHNGAGKTTIMKMLSGYLEANTGTVVVDGTDLELEPKQVQKILGYLPESLPVYAEMTVADYLDFAADLKGLKHSDKTSEIKRVIKATDIAEKLLAPIVTLSRGYKQRVGVAQAILGRPKLLILDEPTNGLDPEQTQHMRDLIREVAQDATVILSTHIMQEVEALCTRVLMLHAGRLALDEQLENLQHSNHLLVESSLPESRLSLLQALDGVEGIAVVATSGESTICRVKTHKDASQKTIAAGIAKILAENNQSLYLLKPELRDLETLFKEVSEGHFNKGDIKNAA